MIFYRTQAAQSTTTTREKADGLLDMLDKDDAKSRQVQIRAWVENAVLMRVS